MKSDVSTPAPLLDQLSRNSTPYQDPLQKIDWSRLDEDTFWLPEQAMSLYGVPEFMDSPLEQRIKCSQYEFLSLVEMTLWLESLLMSRLCEAIHTNHHIYSQACYQLHELREETGHSLMYMELLQRAGLERGVISQQPQRWFQWIRRHASMDSPLFWAVTLIAEELPDRMNRLILRHTESLCPTVVSITKIHTIDESRHIIHANRMLTAKVNSLNVLQKASLSWVLKGFLKRFVSAYYFPAPEYYDLAGLMPGRSWAALAWRNPSRHQLIRQQLATTLRPLQENGISLDWKP